MPTDARYWDSRLETLPPPELRHVQDHRLQWQIQRCWSGSAFYRSRLERAGLGPRDVRGRADLARLPILTERELAADRRAYPPSGSSIVAPRDWWAEQDGLDDSAGETIVLTDGDLIHQTGLAARALWAWGARPRLSRAPTIDVLADGPRVGAMLRRAAEAGLAKIGAASGDREVVVGAASDAPAPPIRAIWLAAVPARGIATPGGEGSDPYLALGHPRVAPTMAFECEARRGLHWAEDHFLLEILDPATLARLPDDRAGALVVTHLTREGSPLIRYWTGLETRLDRSDCACGRTRARSATIARARPLADEP